MLKKISPIFTKHLFRVSIYPSLSWSEGCGLLLICLTVSTRPLNTPQALASALTHALISYMALLFPITQFAPAGPALFCPEDSV